MNKYITYILLATLCFGSLAIAQPVTRYSLLNDLRGSDDVARSLAKQLLVREGAPIVPEILPLLDHDDPKVWNAADKLLADLIHWVGRPGREADRATVSTQVLSHLASSDNTELSRRILRHIPTLIAEGQDLTSVSELLNHPELKEKARVALVRTATTEAIHALAGALNEAEPDFKAAILQGFSQIQKPEVLKPARHWLAHSDPAIAIAAGHAVAWAGDNKDAFPLYAICIETGGMRQQRKEPLLKHLHAMGENGGQVATIMAHSQKILTEFKDDPILQGGVMAILGQYSDERAVNIILSALNDDNVLALGPQAVTALAFQSGRSADNALKAGYETVPVELRPMMLSMLGRRQSEVFIPLMNDALESGNSDLATLALEGLVNSGKFAALKTVTAYAASREGDARTKALDGIEIMANHFAVVGQNKAAGQAWLSLYQNTGDESQKKRAEDGLRRYPIPQAADILVDLLTPEELADTPVDTLLEIIRALREAKLDDQVAGLEKILESRLSTTAGVNTVIAYAREAGTADYWKDRLGFIRSWQLIGPFSWVKSSGFQAPPLDPNAVDTSTPVKEGEEERAWQKAENQHILPHFDLMGPMGGLSDSSAYAYATITLESAEKAKLMLGSDDGIRAWVNGQVVHENNTDRGVLMDSDAVDIQLNAGANTILLQVTQNGGGWGFVARVTNADGLPLNFK